MTARVIDPAGQAGSAAFAAPTMFRRWRAWFGALLLTLTPGLVSAAESEEWPTAPDRGPRSETRIPWMRFSGDPNQPVQVLGQLERGQQVLVVREQELSGRQRRLLRRAERHAEKAAKLRKKAAARGAQGMYAMVVPVAQPAAPARTVVIDQRRPKVQVVRLDREHEGCDEREAGDHVHVPVVIDAEQLSEDVERQVEQALREVERIKVVDAGQISRDVERQVAQALREAERARARAQRDAERSQRDVERARRQGEAARRAVERAKRERRGGDQG